MQEIWKDIVDYEGLYQVSNLGNVKSIGRWIDAKCKGKRWQEEKILKPSVEGQGYLFVSLCKNGKVKFFKVHRLVAQAFISNPNNYPCVNHINEIKDNNKVENLEWCTVKYNNNYNGRQKRIAAKRKKITLQINPNTNEIIAEFPSLNEVEIQTGIRKSNISKCCNGKRNIAGGFKWRYK